MGRVRPEAQAPCVQHIHRTNLQEKIFLYCIADWLLFLTATIMCGSGLAVINNARQVVLSKGGTSSNVSLFVTLLSIFNMAGRGIAGYSSDALASRASRPVFFLAAAAVMGVGLLVLAFAPLSLTYAAGCTVGFAYGALWVLNPSITSEIFGLKWLGSIYSSLAFASVPASLVFNLWLVGGVCEYLFVCLPHGRVFRSDVNVRSRTPVSPDGFISVLFVDAAMVWCATVRALRVALLHHSRSLPLASVCRCSAQPTHAGAHISTHTDAAHLQPHQSQCVGQGCFREAFLVLAGLCLVAVALQAILCVVTRERYFVLHKSSLKR